MTSIRPTAIAFALALTASASTTTWAGNDAHAASSTAVAQPILIAAAASDKHSRSSESRAGAGKHATAASTKKKGRSHAVKRSFRGKASWYGGKPFNGHKTASGERFSTSGKSAAHPTLPLGTEVRVTNLENDRSTVLEVNDRLPPNPKHVIDLSRGAAKELDFVEEGSVPVRVDVLSNPAP